MSVPFEVSNLAAASLESESKMLKQTFSIYTLSSNGVGMSAALVTAHNDSRRDSESKKKLEPHAVLAGLIWRHLNIKLL